MTDLPTITPNPDGGVILHLPDITHLDTQVWSVDIGLTDDALADLRTALNPAPEHCVHSAANHQQHHTSPVPGCPWCTEPTVHDVPTGGAL